MTAKTKPVRVLVTGGAGYIGSVLTRFLLENGYAVTVLDNFMFRPTSLLDVCAHETLDIVRGDARDEGLLKGLLSKSDVVIPLAALVGGPLCDRDHVGAETINAGAVRSICKLASKSQRILLPNTNSGYGIGQKDQFCTEESPLKPITLYGRTKVEAENAVLERGNCVTFRLATVFGASPRMRMDLLVNDFVHRAVTDRTAVLFEGHFKRNYIHVRDVARVFLHALENFDKMKDKPYNVGLEDANLSKIELCEEIKKIIPSFVYLEAPIGEDPDKRDYIVSNKRILSTGWTPEWDLARGIRELIKVYTILRANPYANV
jgi:nucleoside-diphosphate-sugar epimerase